MRANQISENTTDLSIEAYAEIAAISQGKTFKQAAMAGVLSRSSVDDWVGYWHASDWETSLKRFLGFSDLEYARWLRDADALTEIISAKNQLE